MLGKQKCRILKEIRQKIADENDIPYVTRECSYQGECSGTCPRCESELRYLEQQLRAREKLGKTIKTAAVCAGMVLTLSSCAVIDNVIHPEPTATPYIEELSGEVSWPDEEPTPTPEQSSGIGNTDPDNFVLMGDVAYFPESENDK